ncbi:MAG: hypothetical protein IPL83_16410 [Bdellovibrionales bacterium]|nr:hypothetical protein [Bdellovibrionales bacterium]
MKRFSVFVSNLVAVGLLGLPGIGCQSKTNKTPIISKHQKVTSVNQKTAFPSRTKGDGTEICLDLPATIKDLHELGTSIVQVFTVDLFVSNFESKSLELNDKATSIDSVGVDLLKRSQPHALLPFAKEFENGWIEFPSKQDECSSVSFLHVEEASQDPTNGAAGPPPGQGADQKPTLVTTIVESPPSQIIQKSRRSIVYDFTVGKSIIRYGIYREGENSILIKMLSVRSLPSPEGGEKSYLTQVSKRVQWGALKNNVTISLRLARIWIKALGENLTPGVVTEAVGKMKPDADPNSLISIPLDAYVAMNMNASKKIN